jgi:hypothetical protein
MAATTRWAAPTASITVAGPLVRSPAAKTSGRLVWKVRGSTLSVLRALHSSSATAAGSLCWPMAGITASHSITNSESLIGMGRRRPLPSGGPNSARRQASPLTRPPRSQHAQRDCQVLEGDALLAGTGNLVGVSRHFAGRAAVDQGDLGTAQAFGGARRVHGNVAAADDHYPLARFGLALQVDLAQEGHGIDHLAKIRFAGNVQRKALMGADAYEDGLEPLTLQIVQGKILTQSLTGTHGHAQAQNMIDLAIQYVGRQAVVGDAHPQHAAQLGKGFEHGDGIAFQGQVIGHGQAGRSRTDHGDLFSARLDTWAGAVRLDPPGRRQSASRPGWPRAHRLSLRRHCVSQGCGQTRPRVPGNGRRCRISSRPRGICPGRSIVRSPAR